MNDSEVATYVLAYLLRQNYTQTARSFLDECNVLPSQSLLLLPQTPLETVISRFKSINDTRVMVNTLGEANALSALWSKLDATLQQIRCLSEGMVTNPSSRGTVAAGSRTRGRTVHVNTSSSIPHTCPVTSDFDQSSRIPSVQGSPHRRKPVPKRKVFNRVPESAESAGASTNCETPPSPTMQQVLDTLLGDSTLPGKLADIINQCVSSGGSGATDGTVSSEELTSDTLDNILNLTCSEPALENLFTSPDVDHVISNDSHVMPFDQQPSTSTHPLTDHVTDHVTETGPVEKKQRLDDDIPSEQDIDKFLDQLHNQSS